MTHYDLKWLAVFDSRSPPTYAYKVFLKITNGSHRDLYLYCVYAHQVYANISHLTSKSVPAAMIAIGSLQVLDDGRVIVSCRVQQALRGRYCPPIDEALFYAVSSEYELPKDSGLLIEVLDEIKEAAEQQDTADFDPSGTGGISKQNERTDLAKSTSDNDSTSHGVTSVTTGITDFKWTEDDGFGNDLDHLSNDRKEEWLKKVFPAVDASQINEVIARHDGSLDPAIDELLNLAFLSHENENSSAAQSPVLRGIDGFAEDAVGNTRKSRMKKRKHKTNESSRTSSPKSYILDTTVKTPNAWEAVTEAVKYICSRTNLPPGIVKSMYHAEGGQVSSTIRAFAIQEGTAWHSPDHVDPLIQYQIAELKNDFPVVPRDQIYGVFVIARNIPSAAYELLETMTTPTEPEPIGKLHGLAQYEPVDLREENTKPTKPLATSHDITSFGNVRELAAAHGVAASQAFSQAAAAYKKGKSDRLMGGAAAYYSSVGHERMKTAKSLQSAAANAHAFAQSSANVLDLHGVSVADAVRIANSKTQAWWDGLGDTKYAPGGWNPARDGYKIITGVGSHSRNHAPRIGPAVSKMLVREGWKIEIGHGELIVTGKARR